MNIIFLSPHFPVNYFNFCVNLKNSGAKVLGIADISYDNLRKELKESITEYYKVNNLEDFNELSLAVQYFIDKYGEVDRIYSLNEYWLEFEAKIRSKFGIWGVNFDEISKMKQKSQMKKIFTRAGLNVAKGDIVKNENELRNFVSKTGFPIIMKPNSGVGAAGAFKISDNENLENFLKHNKAFNYFAEEFIEGELISFDGLVNQNEKIIFYTSHVFSGGIMEVVTEGTNLSYYSLKDIPTDLMEVGFKVVEAFHLKETFFHIEFFRRYKDKKLVALELNMRPPGGFTTDMFNYASDIDVYKLWAEVLTKNKSQFEYRRKYHCCHIGKKFNRNYKHSRDEIFERYGKNIVLETKIPDILAPAIGNYAFIVRSESLDEIKEMTRFVYE